MSIENIIRRFATVWGQPNTADVDQFLSEYRRSFDGTSADMLDLAADDLIRTSKFWPRPSEVHEAIRKISARGQVGTWRLFPKSDPLPVRTPEEIERANSLMEEFRRAAAKSDLDRAIPVRKPQFPNRDEFRAMQERSVNDHLHRDSRGVVIE